MPSTTTGSIADIAARIRAALPTGWFPPAPAEGEADTAPLLTAVLQGCACGLAAAWDWWAYLAASLRLDTSTGIMIDLWADDFFGYGEFPRLVVDGVTESDASYIARIKSHGLGSQSAVRSSVVGFVQSATGVAPTVVEPQNATDCKGLATRSLSGAGGGYGYGCAGLRYGTMRRSALAFIVLNTTDAVPSADIMNGVAATKAEGVRVWVRTAES